MSIGLEQSPAGAPELTELGKRIEMLRIERGLSKQHLARAVGASRQQLWRVMTGKSELTSSLRQRIADALSVDPTVLALTPLAPAWTSGLALPGAVALGSDIPPPTRSLATFSSLRAAPAGSFSDFLADHARIEAALRALPGGDDGRRLKRALLNAIEDLAIERGLVLDAGFFDLRRRVLHQEL
jgi:transcriptional regulator with XRE-family HTH domain